MAKNEMKYNVIVDNEWIFEGTYEQCRKIADNYWFDDEFFGSCEIISDEEF